MVIDQRICHFPFVIFHFPLLDSRHSIDLTFNGFQMAIGKRQMENVK